MQLCGSGEVYLPSQEESCLVMVSGRFAQGKYQGCPEAAKPRDAPQETRAPGGARSGPCHVRYRNGLSLLIYKFQLIYLAVPVVAENNKER